MQRRCLPPARRATSTLCGSCWTKARRSTARRKAVRHRYSLPATTATSTRRTSGAVAPPGTADTLSTWSAPKNQDHAALIAGVQWKNVYAATGVGPQSPSLRGPAWPWGLRRGTSKRAKGHERDLVIQLRDYEANGGDLDAIRQHIDDAASARVWDVFLANYKCFSRTGDELQMLLPDRVRTTRHLRED